MKQQVVHKVKITNYKPTPSELALGTFDSFGNEYLQLIVDDLWDECALDVTFENGSNKVVVPVGPDLMVAVPPEATAEIATGYNPGKICIRGVANGRQIYTVDIRYIVREHMKTGGSNSSEPTPSELDMLRTLINKAINSAKQPIIGENHNWYIWNPDIGESGEYVDTGLSSTQEISQEGINQMIVQYFESASMIATEQDIDAVLSEL